MAGHSLDPGWWGRLEGDDLNLGLAAEGGAESSLHVKAILANTEATIIAWKSARHRAWRNESSPHTFLSTAITDVVRRRLPFEVLRWSLRLLHFIQLMSWPMW